MVSVKDEEQRRGMGERNGSSCNHVHQSASNFAAFQRPLFRHDARVLIQKNKPEMKSHRMIRYAMLHWTMWIAADQQPRVLRHITGIELGGLSPHQKIHGAKFSVAKYITSNEVSIISMLHNLCNAGVEVASRKSVPMQLSLKCFFYVTVHWYAVCHKSL